MQTLQQHSSLGPFLIIMISAGVTGSAPINSSQLPSHKYNTALLASIVTSLTFISTKKLFSTKDFSTFPLDMFGNFPLIYVCGTASLFLISFRYKNSVKLCQLHKWKIKIPFTEMLN